MVTKTRMSLRLDKKIVSELKLKALAEGKSISQFIIDSKDYFDFKLNDYIFFRIDYINPVAANSNIYRINLFFRETESYRLLRPLWYEMWVSKQQVENDLHLTHDPTRSEFAEFAFRYLSKRYKQCANNLPPETGVFIEHGVEKYMNNRADFWTSYDALIKYSK